MASIKYTVGVLLLLTGGVSAAPNGARPFSIGVSVNPLAKVIEMIEKIKAEVLNESKDEDAIYDNFSCFCKEKNDRLVMMVKHHSSEIQLSSANIESLTADLNELHTDHATRKTNQEKYAKDLEDNTHRLIEETSKWDTTVATYDSNHRLITQALKSLKDSKKQISSGAFLQVSGMSNVKNALELADAMGMIVAPKQKAVAAAFLEGKVGKKSKTKHPLESYDYHEGSDDVIDLIEDIFKQLKEQHDRDGDEFHKAQESISDMIVSLRKKMRANSEAIETNEFTVSDKTKEKAHERQVLIENQGDMEDTDHVLQQITSACESRAKEFDTRNRARTEELRALNAALMALNSAHTSAKKTAEENKKYMDSIKEDGLLQTGAKPVAAASAAGKGATKTGSGVLPVPKVKAEAVPRPAITNMKKVESKPADPKPLSFLQELRNSQKEESESDAVLEDRKRKALDVIRTEGAKVKSLMLMTLAAHSDDDPFAKVKQLITDLRWRLEKEEHAEVEKTVWCDEMLEKTEHERTTRWEEAQYYNMQVVRLEARIDRLKESIKRNLDKAKDIAASLVKIYTDISQLSAAQMRMMNIQKDARDDIKEAIQILRSYYMETAKKGGSTSMVQVKEGEDPFEQLKDFRKERFNIHQENEQRAKSEEGRERERQKKRERRIGDLEGDIPSAMRQGSLGDALALMETIVSDFDREIGNLEGDLDAEHKELHETNQALSAQKEHAEELVKLDKMELETSRVTKESKFNSMQTSMNLLDSALKQLEELRPTCVDTGMSYSERVKARETEMAALKKALCILGETDPKFNCPE